MLLFLSLGEAGVCFLLLIFHFLGKKTKPKSCIFKIIHHLKYLCISCHKKIAGMRPGTVTHDYNPSYLRGRGQEDHS
jgi:hypothetical protein